jgi:peptide-methionine (R)-S-oxide reductase
MDRDDLPKSDDEWKQRLTPMQFHVLRRAGTEIAYTGEHWNRADEGSYRCAGCDAELFTSVQKFRSHCGWPSFFDPLRSDAVTTRSDETLGMRRTEVLCARCGGHLGHVFDDGPPPTGLRYCINSASLRFVPARSG